MTEPESNNSTTPIGHAWLRHRFSLPVPAPAVESWVAPGTRRTEVHGPRVQESYPRQYATGESLVANLRFALRHEPTDLGIMAALFKRIDAVVLEEWIRAEPTGAFARRAWFLYEMMTQRTLDVPDVQTGNYVEALDSARHIAGASRRSRRHRVLDNLLGTYGLCPTVRRTPRLAQSMALRLDKEARRLAEGYDSAVLARAVNFLYTKETRSSFAIENETPSASRADRFVAALKAAPSFNPMDKSSLIRLQGMIVDPRYAATDWRQVQNFVGETVAGYRQAVHFVCPRPEDVHRLMIGWMLLTDQMIDGDIDPVVAAAVVAFAFVFIHPFEDGNGRIHRFLMHHVLAKTGYSPPGVIFPVSAAILRDRQAYDRVLETFSEPIRPFIDWHWTTNQEIVVANDTADLYRYFDATAFAEYLYDRVADTVRQDLREELGFVDTFDRALAAIGHIVDMPDKRASLFVRLCMQNGGRLSAAKRKQFAELTDAEIEALAGAVQQAMEGAKAGEDAT